MKKYTSFKFTSVPEKSLLISRLTWRSETLQWGAKRTKTLNDKNKDFLDDTNFIERV